MIKTKSVQGSGANDSSDIFINDEKLKCINYLPARLFLMKRKICLHFLLPFSIWIFKTD